MIMSKMCWKCGKYHEEGIDSCPFCGASFTSDTERYESDGRTISNKDETAYLRSPPPKYRRQHVILPVVIIGALIVAMVFVVAQDYMTDDPDVRYNYSMVTTTTLPTDTGYVLPDEGMQFVIMEIVIVNDSVSSGVRSDVLVWEFSLNSNGNWYPMDDLTRSYRYYQEPITLRIGGTATFYEVFQIPSGSGVSDVSLNYHGEGKASHDTHIRIM